MEVSNNNNAISQVGQKRLATYKILFPDKFEGFEDLFCEELDSWFTADIACCDECYNEFISKWPAIYLREIEFQANSIPLDAFYSGSIFSELFTEKEFFENIHRIHCPRCGSPLRHNIWPYNFPFEVPKDFEHEIKEIANLVSRYPFLVLTHPFAKKVFDEIRRMVDLFKPENFNSYFYRGRPKEKVKETSADELGPPKPNITTEGRYNHAGKPVLYLSSDVETCFLEVGEPSKGIYVAKINLLNQLKILDFLLDELDSDVLKSLIVSSLLSAPDTNDGWLKPAYIFSRFVSDCANHAGFDGIKYPSVRSTNGYNLVVFNNSLDWKKTFEIVSIEPYSHDNVHTQLRNKMGKRY